MIETTLKVQLLWQEKVSRDRHDDERNLAQPKLPEILNPTPLELQQQSA